MRNCSNNRNLNPCCPSFPEPGPSCLWIRPIGTPKTSKTEHDNYSTTFSSYWTARNYRTSHRSSQSCSRPRNPSPQEGEASRKSRTPTGFEGRVQVWKNLHAKVQRPFLSISMFNICERFYLGLDICVVFFLIFIVTSLMGRNCKGYWKVVCLMFYLATNIPKGLEWNEI